MVSVRTCRIQAIFIIIYSAMSLMSSFKGIARLNRYSSLMLCHRSLNNELLSKRSEITESTIFGRKVFFFRDDTTSIIVGNNQKPDKSYALGTIDCGILTINGNKMRKLAFLLDDNEGRDPPSQYTNIDAFVSFGGIQSNAMAAIAKLAYKTNRDFYYICPTIPNYLRNKLLDIAKYQEDDIDNCDNFTLALLCGMQLVEVDSETYNEIYDNRYEFQNVQKKLSVQQLLQGPLSKINNSLTSVDKWMWIPQGVSMIEARSGVNTLIDEILLFVKAVNSNKPWKIIFASGTGCSAYFAAQRLEYHKQNSINIDVEIIAVPCVGSSEDLAQDLSQLEGYCRGSKLENFSLTRPTILSTSSTPKREFAKPYLDHLNIHSVIETETKITTFDLIYMPRAMEILKTASYEHKGSLVSLLDLDCEILYYHCGGSEGNISQLKRYERLKSNLKK